MAEETAKFPNGEKVTQESLKFTISEFERVKDITEEKAILLRRLVEDPTKYQEVVDALVQSSADKYKA